MRNMQKLVLGGFVLLTAFALTGLAFAETTYLYVDQNGDLKAVNAHNPSEAIANAENRHPHSGVIIASEMGIGGEGSFDSGETEYLYVDIYGNLRSEFASSPMEAIAQAELRVYDSGVIVANNM